MNIRNATLTESLKKSLGPNIVLVFFVYKLKECSSHILPVKEIGGKKRPNH